MKKSPTFIHTQDVTTPKRISDIVEYSANLRQFICPTPVPPYSMVAERNVFSDMICFYPSNYSADMGLSIHTTVEIHCLLFFLEEFQQCGILFRTMWNNRKCPKFPGLRKNLIITLFKNRHLGSTISGHFKTIRIEWTGSQKNFFFTQPHFSALDF